MIFIVWNFSSLSLKSGGGAISVFDGVDMVAGAEAGGIVCSVLIGWVLLSFLHANCDIQIAPNMKISVMYLSCILYSIRLVEDKIFLNSASKMSRKSTDSIDMHIVV